MTLLSKRRVTISILGQIQSIHILATSADRRFYYYIKPSSPLSIYSHCDWETWQLTVTNRRLSPFFYSSCRTHPTHLPIITSPLPASTVVSSMSLCSPRYQPLLNSNLLLIGELLREPPHRLSRDSVDCCPLRSKIPKVPVVDRHLPLKPDYYHLVLALL